MQLETSQKSQEQRVRGPWAHDRSLGLGAPKVPDMQILLGHRGLGMELGTVAEAQEKPRARGVGNSGLAAVASLGVQKVLLGEV